MTHIKDTDTAALYARFPHLARIDTLWGSPECRTLLVDLLTENRDGKRQGFPAQHASTLFSLLNEHDRRFPEFDTSQAIHGWLDVDRRGIKG